MVNAETGEFDPEIISALGLPPIFPKLQKPGTVLGEYDGIKCILCATHDTASAVEGIPMVENAPYISSGTWSLLGVKTPKPITDEASRAANYSNEGGVGYNRYQKNIMGMWLVNELQKELCSGLGFAEIVNAAKESPCNVLINANAPEFLAPKSMKTTFDAATGGFSASATISAVPTAALQRAMRKPLHSWNETLESNTTSCTLWVAARRMSFSTISPPRLPASGSLPCPWRRQRWAI